MVKHYEHLSKAHITHVLSCMTEWKPNANPAATAAEPPGTSALD